MIESKFFVDWNGRQISVEPLLHKGTTVYKCVVQEQILLLTTGLGANGKKFWTFLPPKDPQTATEIGKLIDAHISKH